MRLNCVTWDKGITGAEMKKLLYGFSRPTTDQIERILLGIRPISKFLTVKNSIKPPFDLGYKGRICTIPPWHGRGDYKHEFKKA